MSALAMSPRADTLNDRANDFVGFFLHGLGDTGDCAEAERTYREFQDEVCEASTERVLALTNAATDDRGLPRLIPAQRYCWACDKAFETTNPRQQNCDECIAHYRGLRDELQDPQVGPVHIDTAALEAWEHSRATDFDVTDDVPFD